MSEKVAIVTGSNKGIGLQIVKNLCARFDGTVYLTARNVERGKAAVEQLRKEGLSPAFHQLDTTDKKSIDAFSAFIKQQHGGIDVLVNNAAIYLLDSKEPYHIIAEHTLRTNYYALKDVCNSLYPLLRFGARVVTVSSMMGHLQFAIPGAELRERFSKADLTEEELDELMEEYVQAAKEGKDVEKGWRHVGRGYLSQESGTAYSVSKVGASALTRIHHKRFLNDPRDDIVINHVHPGYVATDLNGFSGYLTVVQGADAPTFAALLPPHCNSPKGDMIWWRKEIVDWVNGPIPDAAKEYEHSQD